MNGQEISLKIGNLYPYDGAMNGRPDWAVKAARGVIADLQDRRGTKKIFEKVDEDIRSEIVASLAEIIRLAYKQYAKEYPAVRGVGESNGAVAEVGEGGGS